MNKNTISQKDENASYKYKKKLAASWIRITY